MSTNSLYVYHPDSTVIAAHKLPRVGDNSNVSFHLLRSVSSGGSSLDVNYIKSISIFPLTLFGLVLLSVLLFQFTPIVGWMATHFDSEHKDDVDDDAEESRFPWIAFIFLMAVLCTFIASVSVFEGFSQFTMSSQTGGEKLTQLKSLFAAITDQGHEMTTCPTNINSMLSTKDCQFVTSSYTASISSMAGEFSSAGNSVIDKVGNLPHILSILTSYFSHVFKGQSQSMYLVTFVVVVIVCVIFLMATALRNERVLLVGIGLAEVVTVALTALSCLEMIVVVRASTCTCIG